MKVGVRKPSLKKSIKARTTGKIKRSVKKNLIPGYGKKGMGWVKNPKKAAYNKVYNKTSVSIFPMGLFNGKSKKNKTTKNTICNTISIDDQSVKQRKTWLWVLGWLIVFPVPLTIIIIRNQKLNKWLKIAIIVIAWIVYIGIGLSASTPTNEIENNNQNIMTQQQETELYTQQTINNVADKISTAEIVFQDYYSIRNISL